MGPLAFPRPLSVPEFLAFYSVAVGVAIVVCRHIVQRSDRTDSLPPIPVSPPPDRYELAYLRGGEAEMARLAVLALLLHRGDS